MPPPRHDEVIPILDFGTQYAQLIARRVREKGVYSELVRPDISIDELKRLNPKGIILSGGPSSVYEPGAPKCDPRLFDLGVPVLGLPQDTTVWMSHGDQVHDLPADFVPLATTPTCPYAAARHKTRAFYGVQFHPEVTHTPRGEQVFQNFLYEICKCSGLWTMGNFIEQAARKVREQVGTGKVICGLPGGVD